MKRSVLFMNLKRYFTESSLTHGKTVYDLFQWKKVDVNITDYKSGKTLFKADGLEFPKDYSQSACDITAKMYFRKNGVPETEHEISMRQVAHRMVNFWTLSMVDEGIITSEQLPIVYDELVFMLLNQMWAPNSPQWFNTGLNHSYGITGNPNGLSCYNELSGRVMEAEDSYTRTQASACFIVGVEDSLVGEQSLMDNLTTASRLFKYGSGIGSNWSKIRGTGESLSSGGKSSGLLSFQKVFDRNAGAIKSGGTTRRAAVMEVLDIDHPEILDFVRWKSREEDKVVALGKMGYDISIAGDAYETVSGQNVNNSVVIPDEFMKKIESGDAEATWELKGRKDHDVDSTIKANDLWEEIAWSAWRCGDPGVHFTDHINKWNTCPNSGRIRASNPCFTGDMCILTDKGYIPIGELTDQDVMIVNKDGNYSSGKVWCSGEKPTIILRLSDHSIIECTRDHRFMTITGDEIEAQYLKGNKLMPLLPQLENEIFDTTWMQFGFLQGDGGLNRFNDKYQHHHGLEVYFGEKDDDIFEIFNKNKEDMEFNKENHCFYLSQDDGVDYEKELTKLQFSFKPLPERIFPITYDSWNYKNKASFLRGCYSANGSVIAITRVSYKTSCKEFAEKLSETLERDFNIHAYITTNKEHDVRFNNGVYTCKESYDVNIHQYKDIQKFASSIGFIQKYKRNSLSSLLERRALKVVGIREGSVKKVYDFEEPITHWGVVEGCVVHNCSEYLFLDDTACNLASINVLKFYSSWSEKFDLDGYLHAITIIQLVLEASIHWGVFPTKQIAKNTYLYRTTGLGLTNMAALLMQLAIPYDSDDARAVMATLCSIMTGQSYLTSARMAKAVGPFSEFEKNRSEMLGVIEMHKMASNRIDNNSLTSLFSSANVDNIEWIWDKAFKLGEKYGYRNAQVTVLAPTGTIAFEMDCDSTSSEPFFSHVTYKKIVDGSFMKMVNPIVESALIKLKYDGDQFMDIIDYINNGDGKIEGAPHIKDKHLSVFDTANRCGSGVRYLSPEAHVKMVAAMQPHLSGGISKTVNLPADATTEDVKNIYMLAWKLGCKCIALYRDGSKVVQPLTTTKDEITDSNDISKLNYMELLKLAQELMEKSTKASDQDLLVRKRLPYEPKCIKNSVKMSGHTFHIQRAFYEDGRLGEIFATVGKQGDTVKGLMEVICILISKSLQYGIPTDVISSILRNTDFGPNGLVQQHPYIKSASSIPDLISKFIDISEDNYTYCQIKPTPLKDIPKFDNNSYQSKSFEDVNKGITETIPEALRNINKKIEGELVYGKKCHECGSTRIVKAGTCYYCQDCGASSGCS